MSERASRLVGPLACDEANRHALHQSRRQPREQPLGVRAARFDQQRLVALDGLQRVPREAVGVVGRLDALALQEVVAAVESADGALVENRGLDRRRADGQHADAVRRGLRAQRQRQPDDGVFGRHVAGDLSGRGQPGHRCGVDDVAVALLDHLRVGGGDAVHDAADIHVDDRVPLVEGQQFGVAAPHDARVVEHQVESAGAGDDIVDHRLHRCGVGDVEAGRACPVAERRRRALGGVAVDVGADHVRACADERATQRRADAGSGTGDDCLLAG